MIPDADPVGCPARTTGRGGTGSAAAKAEQRIIIEPLELNTA